MRTIRKKVGLAVIILMALLIGVYSVFGRLMEQQRLAAIAALGKPESIEAFETAKKARNAAARPATTPTPEDGNPSAKSSLTLSDVPTPKDRIASFESCRAMLDAFEDDSEWSQQWESIDDGNPLNQWTEEKWRQLGEFLTKTEPLLNQIRRLFLQEGPISAPEMDPAKRDSEMKAASTVREFTRLFNFAAIFEAHAGDYHAALEHIFSAFQAGDLLKNELSTTSQLSLSACNGVARARLCETFAPGKLTSVQTDRLASYVATALDRDAFSETFNVEAYRMAQILEPTYFQEHSGFDGLFWQFYSSPVARPLFNRDAATYLSYAREIALAARQPFYEARRQISALDDQLHTTPFVPLTTLGTRMSGGLSIVSSYAQYETSLSLMAVGLRLEQYQAETARVPDTLDAIAHYFDGHVPVDPYTGEPFRYIPRQDGFRLYSVGGNLKDDGGEERAHADIVWRNKAGF